MFAPSRTATSVRLAAVAAALAIVATLLAQPALGPAGVRAMGPLPDCRYDDVLTTPRGYDDWSVTLVDTILRIPKGYVPPDLVPASQAGIAGGGKVRAVMIDDLEAMTEAAAIAGNAIGVQSAYRSYAEQKTVFDGWVDLYGYERALEVSARPGHSEHQLGVAIDFRSEPGGEPFTGTWGSTPAGKWMKANSWAYGFVMSYPKGTMALSCYAYEPWHFRYVGRDLAALIRASGLSPREYLWANFTTTVVPPPPPPTKAPPGTAAPTAGPSPTPTVEPSIGSTLAPPTAGPIPTGTPVPATAAPAATETQSPVTEPAAGTEPAALASVGIALGASAISVIAWLVLRRRRRG